MVRTGLAALGWLAGGFVAGGIVGIAVVDETDPTGSHPGLNIAIVLLLGAGGLLAVATGLVRARRRGGVVTGPGARGRGMSVEGASSASVRHTDPPVSGRPVTYRQMQQHELSRVGEIDRSERIDTIYVQRGVELEAIAYDSSARPWHPEGADEHSVAHQVEECERYLTAGGTAIGAFADGRLVGIGIVVPHVRDGVAQLAFLQVGDGYRGHGIGSRLSAQLEELARDLGDTVIVVSATPSANTVRFYQGRRFEPTADPLPELYELEPDDVHMEKRL